MNAVGWKRARDLAPGDVFLAYLGTGHVPAVVVDVRIVSGLPTVGVRATVDAGGWDVFVTPRHDERVVVFADGAS